MEEQGDPVEDGVLRDGDGKPVGCWWRWKLGEEREEMDCPSCYGLGVCGVE